MVSLEDAKFAFSVIVIDGGWYDDEASYSSFLGTLDNSHVSLLMLEGTLLKHES